MQLLTFSVAGQAYAIPSRKVIEVLPLVAARPIPHTPDYVSGVFTYRGQLVPLVDLGRRFGTEVEVRLVESRDAGADHDVFAVRWSPGAAAAGVA